MCMHRSLTTKQIQLPQSRVNSFSCQADNVLSLTLLSPDELANVGARTHRVMRHNPQCETVSVVYPDPDLRGSGNTIRVTAGETSKSRRYLSDLKNRWEPVGTWHTTERALLTPRLKVIAEREQTSKRMGTVADAAAYRVTMARLLSVLSPLWCKHQGMGGLPTRLRFRYRRHNSNHLRA